MTAATLPSAVRLLASPVTPDAVLLSVTVDDDAEVIVRWRLTRHPAAWRWRCGVCGSMPRAECAHTFAAGLALADQLLGLTAAATDPETSTNNHEEIP